jgi:hypothetical protein
MHPMKKRIAVGALWLYAGWCLGAFIAWMLGVSAILGPVLGFAAAAVIAGDPFKVIWKPSESLATARRRTLARSASTAAAK